MPTLFRITVCIIWGHVRVIIYMVMKYYSCTVCALTVPAPGPGNGGGRGLVKLKLYTTLVMEMSVGWPARARSSESRLLISISLQQIFSWIDTFHYTYRTDIIIIIVYFGIYTLAIGMYYKSVGGHRRRPGAEFGGTEKIPQTKISDDLFLVIDHDFQIFCLLCVKCDIWHIYGPFFMRKASI